MESGERREERGERREERKERRDERAERREERRERREERERETACAWIRILQYIHIYIYIERGVRTEERREKRGGERREPAHGSVYCTIYTYFIYNILYTYKLCTCVCARWCRPVGAVCGERAATSVCALTLVVYAALRY